MFRASSTTQSASFKIRLVTLVSVACLLLGCASMGKSKETAEHAVELVHLQLDSERYSDMYGQADEDFKKSASQEEFEKLVRAVHQKLGNVRAANQVGYLVNVGSEAMVTMTYDTAFVGGEAKEQFVWRVRDDRATLYNYSINSADLVTK